MATTWIKTAHQKKGKSAKESIKVYLNYFLNPYKTDDGRLVSYFECSPSGVGEDIAYDFTITKDKYAYTTGRMETNPIIAYSIRQSFLPGEIEPEKALEIGRELAMKITDGMFSFVVATHIDKEHIHNHLFLNAYNNDGQSKLTNPYHSYRLIRDISDEICNENGLSVVQEPGLDSGAYSLIEEYKKQNNNNMPTKQKELELYIESVIRIEEPKSMEDFYQLLIAYGCEIRDKTSRGRSRKYVTVRMPGHIKARRFDSLSDDFGEEALIKRFEQFKMNDTVEEQGKKSIALNNATPEDYMPDIEIYEWNDDEFIGIEQSMKDEKHDFDYTIDEARLRSKPSIKFERTHMPEVATEQTQGETKRKTEYYKKPREGEQWKRSDRYRDMNVSIIKLMIDIENDAKAQQSDGYKNWAVIHNLKKASETLLFLQDNYLENLDMLNNHVENSEGRISNIQEEIKIIDERLKDIAMLQKQISAYSKTSKVYEEYQLSKQNPDFYRKHKATIDTCVDAKQFIDSKGLEQIPKYKELQSEYSTLLAEKNRAYAERNNLKKEMRDYINAKRNIDMILDGDGTPENERSRDRTKPRNDNIR